MKRSKQLYVLLGILAAVCIATFVLTRMEEEKEQIKATGEIVLEVPADEVTSLSWDYGGNTLSFHKEENTWVYDGDEAFPVDPDKINGLLEQFEALGVSFIIEEVADFSPYGLDRPQCVIRFTAAEQSYTVEVGNYSNMDAQRYLSIGDGNVYLAKIDPLEAFDALLSDLILHDEDLSYAQVKEIRFEGAENYTIYYEAHSTATYCPEDVYFTRQDEETLPLNTTRVDNWLSVLTTLDPTDYVTYNVTQEELESFGLAEPELTVSVDYVTEEGEYEDSVDTFVLSVSRDPEELARAEEAEAKGDEPGEVSYYVRIGESQIVYRLSEYTGNSLTAVSFNELRHRDVLTAPFDDVSRLDVTLEGVDHTFTAGDGKGDERIWTYLEEEMEISPLQDAIESLDAEYATDFVSHSPTGKEEIRMTVWLDNEHHPKVEIGLYREDGENCLAVVDGETFALVPRSDTMELVEAVNAIVLN